MPSLTLVLRALWFRRGVSVAVLLVATITTAAAAMGPLYQRAGSESVLRDALVAAKPSASGIDVTYADLPQNDPLKQVRDMVARAHAPFAHTRRILSLQNSIHTAGKQGGVQSRLMWREGACDHLRITAGRCPTNPTDALISTRMARSTGFRIGDTVGGCPGAQTSFDACQQPGGDVTIKVVGTYALPDPDPYWFDAGYFDAHAGNNDSADTLDTTFMSQSGLEDLPETANITAEAQYLIDPATVRLDDEPRLKRELSHFTAALENGAEGTRALTLLDQVLSSADDDRHDLGRSVLVVTLQLVALAFVVLRLVVADASEARGAEVALAKLRGYRAGATLALGLLEPVVLLVLAVPLGLLVADVFVHLLGSAVLAPDTPVTVRLPSLLAAGGALLGGVVAAAWAGRRVLTRPVLEQWRRTGDVQPGRATVVAEAVIGLGSAVALVGLLSRGALKEGSHNGLALLVPILVVVVVGVLGTRLLPVACRLLVRRTRASPRLGPFLAVRSVARRPAGLRLAALLAVAVGLATFAVDGTLVAAGNRAERAATDVGADGVVTVRTEGTADLQALVRKVDPDGTWAMATELWLPFGGLRGTVLAVDTRAFPKVAHWRSDFSTLSQPALARAIGGAAPAPITVTGDRLGVTLTPLVMPTPTHDVRALVTDTTGQHTVALGTLRSGTHRYDAVLTGCSAGCTLDGIVVPRGSEPGADVKGTLELSGVSQRLGGAWAPIALDLSQDGAWHQRLVNSPASSTVTATRSGVTWRFSVGGGDEPLLLRSALPWPLRMATGHGTVLDPAFPSMANFDAQEVPIAPVTDVDVVPTQGREASLVDLDFVRIALPRFEEFATQQVWLSGDAPADAVSQLDKAGLQIVGTRTTAQRRDLLDRSAPALGLLLFAFAAAAAAVLAAGATAVALYLSGRRRSFELAAMLVVGASRRSLLAAAVGEQLLVLGTALVLGVVGGLGSALLVLPAVPELPTDDPPDLRYAPHVGGLAL
ncbi:MAG: hypothetical protein JWO22_4133, partial [Frankiales bacterium]|nr:hypothetical protein [Frankiales bacterium]